MAGAPIPRSSTQLSGRRQRPGMAADRRAAAGSWLGPPATGLPRLQAVAPTSRARGSVIWIISALSSSDERACRRVLWELRVPTAAGSQEGPAAQESVAPTSLRGKLGPQPTRQGLEKSGLASETRQASGYAGKPQCRFALFHPPYSSERRRCYTSRTSSVWSHRQIPAAPKPVPA